MSGSGSFILDGREIPFEEGDTIIDAALRAGEYIPHLCHHPEFSPHGSCRICLVEVNGRQASACTLPAAAGQEIVNDSEQLNRQRRMLLQMLFVEGNHVCPGCEKSGACQLQAAAYYTGMLAPHFSQLSSRLPLDASHRDVTIDFNRCILCELCVRASRDVDRKNIFAVDGRGIGSHLVINSSTGKLGDSNFSISDRAAQVCPVGAILPGNTAYAVPIGRRLYDQQPISVVGDVAVQEDDRER